MTLVKLILDVKDSAWISANPTKILSLNEPIYRNDGLVAYGDGVTPLSGLVFKPLFSGGGSVDSVTGTANRIAVTGTASDPIINIDSAYDTAITNLLNTKVVPFTHSPSAVISPADGQFYYFGMQNLAATNSAGSTTTNLREYGAPVTGTIIAAVISIRLDNGTTVSSETSTLYLRNTTQNTLETITSTFTYVATGSPSFKSVVVTGLNIAITVGDLCMSVIGNPNFATNPSNVYYRVDYLIRP